MNVQISRGICPDGSTVCELVDRYLVTRTGLRSSTQAGYKTIRNILAKEEFGSRKIDKIKEPLIKAASSLHLLQICNFYER